MISFAFMKTIFYNFTTFSMQFNFSLIFFSELTVYIVTCGPATHSVKNVFQYQENTIVRMIICIKLFTSKHVNNICIAFIICNGDSQSPC